MYIITRKIIKRKTLKYKYFIGLSVVFDHEHRVEFINYFSMKITKVGVVHCILLLIGLGKVGLMKRRFSKSLLTNGKSVNFQIDNETD